MLKTASRTRSSVGRVAPRGARSGCPLKVPATTRTSGRDALRLERAEALLERGTQHAVLRVGQAGILAQHLDRRTPCPLQQRRVFGQACDLELRQAGLLGAEQVALPAQGQVHLGKAEAVALGFDGLKPASGQLAVRV